jgi:hypothetical protein
MNALRACSLFLALVLALVSSPARAAMHAPADATTPPTAETPPTTEPPAAEPIDLSAAREAANARRVADPSPANWRAEGQLAEQAGDFAAASDAYEQALGRMDPQDPTRAAVQEDLSRVRDRARGIVSDEGASTHRGELDQKWVTPATGPRSPRAQPKQLPKDAPRDDRIVKKWYFWVTIGAIAASAAAVTAIAIKAARDDKPDALDRRATFGIGAGMLRF